jgi:hypothetical protein
LQLKKQNENWWFSLSGLLLAAAILHLTLATTVFVLGRQRTLPGVFDEYGTAISVTPDAIDYREDAATLVQLLQSSNFLAWFSAPYPFHLKLYSVCFAIFGWFTGFNILAAEPLNLLYYLGILAVVGKLGSEAFSARAGLMAAATVALWPSFLLHTTQLVKDPLFILGMLALIFTMMRLVTRTQPMRTSLLGGLGGGFIAALLWKARPDLSPLLIATLMLGALIVVLRQVQLKRVLRSNLAGMILLFALALAAVLLLPVHRAEDHPRHQAERSPAHASAAYEAKAKRVAGWWQVGMRVGILRERFVEMYPDSGSGVDTDVRLANNRDLIRYLPRATAVGLFAPFPGMWFETGHSVGSGGRMVSGLETLVMYAVEILALLGLWQGRRRLSVWMLFAVALMGTIALGLAVTNIGALYRLRYTFLILLIILSGGGITHLLDWSTRRLSAVKRIDA